MITYEHFYIFFICSLLINKAEIKQTSHQILQSILDFGVKTKIDIP